MLELLAAIALHAVAIDAPAHIQQDPVRTDFVGLFEGREKEALLELWREHPESILTTIDADLEGALALWEQSPESPDSEAIALHHERALWGALAASEITCW